MASRQQPSRRPVRNLVFSRLPFFLNLNLNFSLSILSRMLSYINCKCVHFSVSVFSANRSSFGLTLGSRTKCRCGSEKERLKSCQSAPIIRLPVVVVVVFSRDSLFLGYASHDHVQQRRATSCSAFSLSAFIF